MKDELVYIKQILDSVSKIENFTVETTQEDFVKNQMMQSAVIMQLILVGELAKKLKDNVQKSIDLPWKDIMGFRDRAIHDYFEMDLKMVWETVEKDVPDLKSKLAPFLL